MHIYSSASVVPVLVPFGIYCQQVWLRGFRRRENSTVYRIYRSHGISDNSIVKLPTPSRWHAGCQTRLVCVRGSAIADRSGTQVLPGARYQDQQARRAAGTRSQRQCQTDSRRWYRTASTKHHGDGSNWLFKQMNQSW